MSKPHLTVVRNEETKEATIRLYGVIGDDWFSDADPLTAQKFQKEFSLLEAGFDVINIRINSPGGSVWDGLAIANAIKASKKDVHTWNDGLAASMGAVILVSAKKGNRHAAKGSITMIHSASSYEGGNAENMREAATALDAYDEVLATFFADAIGEDVAKIKADYFDGKDHYLTGQQAADLGFVTVEDYQSEEMPANIMAMSFMQVAALYKPEAKAEDKPSSSFMKIVIDEVKTFLNPKSNTEMKFPKLEALAKLGAENLTEELVNSAKTELAEAEIEGVSIVLDSEIEVLNQSVTDLAMTRQTLTDKETELATATAKIVALEAKLAKPAAEAGAVDTSVQDAIDAAENQPSYNTSVDDELKKYNV